MAEATKTAKQRIKTFLPWFESTVSVYREAVAFLSEVVKREWSLIKPEKGLKRVNLVEKLVHHSKKSPSPKYNFDEKFPKFPSFLRRRAIQEAIGYVASYKSQLSKWRKKKKGVSRLLQRQHVEISFKRKSQTQALEWERMALVRGGIRTCGAP